MRLQDAEGAEDSSVDAVLSLDRGAWNRHDLRVGFAVRPCCAQPALGDRQGLIVALAHGAHQAGEAVLEFVRAGDTLVVWKLDRLGRSLKDLIYVVSGRWSRGFAWLPPDRICERAIFLLRI